MPQLLLLTKFSVILLLIPPNECRQIPDSTDEAESQLLKGLLNAQPIESKLLPFVQQQAPKSLEGPLISVSSYELAKPLANFKLSESSQRSIYPQGLESSWSLIDSHWKKALLPSLDSNHLKPSTYSKGQESSWYLKEPHSKKLPVLPLFDPNYPSEEVPSSKPLISDLVGPLDESFESSNTVRFSEAKSTLCELKKLLKGTLSSADDSNGQKLPVVLLHPKSYENLDQPLTFRTRPRNLKLRNQLAHNRHGNRIIHKSLAKKNRSTDKKLKIFEKPEDEMKFKQKLKQQLIHKVKKQKKDKKVKISEGSAGLLKKAWMFPRNGSSRKSKTQRCFKTRKQDGSDSRTVCVTYPPSWGEGANYYYPYYYYPTYYYYPYYFYGRR